MTKPKEKEPRIIGNIGNYYGCLEVRETEKKYYWSIANYDGHYWEEIPEYLYRALIKFDDSLITNN